MNLRNLSLGFKRDLLKIILLAIVSLFIGLVIGFYLLIQFPHPFFPVPILQEDGDLLRQFISYLITFFSGDWGYSYSFSLPIFSLPILEIMRLSVSRMVEILIIPLIIGWILGTRLGKFTEKKNHVKIKRILDVLFSIGALSLIYWVGYLFQRLSLGIIPEDNWSYEPPVITGFLILDSMIAGNWQFSSEVIIQYLLPSLFLTVSITSFIAKRVSSRNSSNSIISNSLRISANFSMIFTFYLLVDITFYLRGFGSNFISSLRNLDYYLFRGYLYTFIILFVVIFFISNLRFLIVQSFFKDKLETISINDIQNTEKEKATRNKIKKDLDDLKNYLKTGIKSPLSIIGGLIIIFFIFISIFPQVFTPYSYEEALNINPGAWLPPSPEHPLGQIYWGFDLLAHLIYGIRDILISGGYSVLIGLIGGLLFGIIGSSFKGSEKSLVLAIMVAFYIFPNIAIMLIMATIYNYNQSSLVFILGILLIPMFTRKITESKSSFLEISRSLIIYVPWVFAFTVFIYTSVGFLGIHSYESINLGFIIYRTYEYHMVLEQFRAIFWPGLAILLFLIGLIFLHEGLKDQKMI